MEMARVAHAHRLIRVVLCALALGALAATGGRASHLSDRMRSTASGRPPAPTPFA